MTSFAAGVDDVVDDVDGTEVNSRHRDVAKTRGDLSAAVSHSLNAQQVTPHVMMKSLLHMPQVASSRKA